MRSNNCRRISHLPHPSPSPKPRHAQLLSARLIENRIQRQFIKRILMLPLRFKRNLHHHIRRCFKLRAVHPRSQPQQQNQKQSNQFHSSHPFLIGGEISPLASRLFLNSILSASHSNFCPINFTAIIPTSAISVSGPPYEK